MGRRPRPVRDRVVSIGDSPHLSYKLSKVWRVHVWLNYNEKTDFYVQLLIGFIPSHKESPNFWHVISQLRTTLYWNHIVPGPQGSAARKIRNHWISPTFPFLSSHKDREISKWLFTIWCLLPEWITWEAEMLLQTWKSYASWERSQTCKTGGKQKDGSPRKKTESYPWHR